MNAATDDVGFVDAMLNRLIDDYPIDTSRIYATGSSNGGMMCYRLACELGHRIAAIAPNACSHMPVNCNPANKMPIISFHSKVDPIVFYTGGLGGNPILASIYFPSQDSVRHIWKNLNSCLSIDTVINGNGNNFDFIKVTDCACNVELHHYATTDGSHSWPGGNPNNNPVSTQISATDLLWSFFQNYTLGCLTTSTKETYNSHTTRVFPNPFTGNLYIKDININEQFELLNSTGQIIWAGRLSNQPDFSYLQGGIYLLKGNGKTFKLIKQ
jgi:polyhydroxybutyrate depolymerase